MPVLNKLVESDKITYTITTPAGDVTVVLQKSDPGILEYTVAYADGSESLPTWQDFSTMLEGNTEINLL